MSNFKNVKNFNIKNTNTKLHNNYIFHGRLAYWFNVSHKISSWPGIYVFLQDIMFDRIAQIIQKDGLT